LVHVEDIATYTAVPEARRERHVGATAENYRVMQVAKLVEEVVPEAPFCRRSRPLQAQLPGQPAMGAAGGMSIEGDEGWYSRHARACLERMSRAGSAFRSGRKANSICMDLPML
jgi:hypothetical protein